MSAKTVEVVFVIDASESMRPCFEGLTRNLESLLKPLQGFNFEVRLGLVALNVFQRSPGRPFHTWTWTMAGAPWSNPEEAIYDRQKGEVFTSLPDLFLSRLRAIELQGDGQTLLALDMALDHPFGPVNTTRRVVALFSDERIEDGAVSDEDVKKLPALLQKVAARRVLLFGALPGSPLLDDLASADRSQFETVSGGGGLASVDFSKLLGQMAKSISVASLQGNEGDYARALWGQDRWVSERKAKQEAVRRQRDVQQVAAPRRASSRKRRTTGGTRSGGHSAATQVDRLERQRPVVPVSAGDGNQARMSGPDLSKLRTTGSGVRVPKETEQ